MTDRLEALAAEFDGSAEACREIDDHGTADAWETAAGRVREVAAELAPRVMPGLDGASADPSSAATTELDKAPAPIYDDVHAQVHGESTS